MLLRFLGLALVFSKWRAINSCCFPAFKKADPTSSYFIFLI
ncbi:hypothetical protein ppKF707_1860 [Metapseudomonas furukawaii]|uniref:Uncharacterized protein n=1 Tax=Metapseudomonas furukawaii TaxID=1149133 RepID=A0AAD1C6M2_METFU|nr:hypothetical protein ppKF707_1860 [Pseudomonas furukawaii]BAU76854.1 hypothetical protein KF707C_51660 [Pseudomonas furukawaii]